MEMDDNMEQLNIFMEAYINEIVEPTIIDKVINIINKYDPIKKGYDKICSSIYHSFMYIIYSIFGIIYRYIYSKNDDKFIDLMNNMLLDSNFFTLQKLSEILVPILLRKADEGHSSTQYIIGMCYLNGYGTNIDFEKAKKYFKKSANQKYTKAIYELAKIEKNSGLMKTAARKGNVDAIYELSDKYYEQKKYNETFKLLKNAYVQNSLKQYNLLDTLYCGLHLKLDKFDYDYLYDNYRIPKIKRKIAQVICHTLFSINIRNRIVRYLPTYVRFTMNDLV